MRKFLSKTFLHNIHTESFKSFLIQAWDVVAVAHNAMLKTKFSSISREYFSRAIKVILPKPEFDFTVGRLSQNVKILHRWIYDICLQLKGAQGGGLQKRNIYHICIFDH